MTIEQKLQEGEVRPAERPQRLISSWDLEFVERHGLGDMDVYRTNGAVDLSVHLTTDQVRDNVSRWTPQEKNSVLRTLGALEEDGDLDKEFTTRLGDTPFLQEEERESRKSTVRDLLDILQEKKKAEVEQE